MSSWADARRGSGARSSAQTDGYRNAAVCLRGHAATSDVALSPERAGKFCKDCGSEITTTCPSCKAPIRGHYHVSGVISLQEYTPPNYCEDCGQPFPWMEEKLKSAAELADELDGFTDADRAKVKQSLADIAKDGPETSLATIRLKKWFGAATDAVGKAIWKAAVDIGTEAAKKALLS